MPRLFVTSLVALIVHLASIPLSAQVDRRRPSTAPAVDLGRATRRVSCVLQIDVDAAARGTRPTDTQTLNALLSSTALVDPGLPRVIDGKVFVACHDGGVYVIADTFTAKH